MTTADFRAARKALGLTQHQLAEALRMGKHGWQTISAWENGKSPIPGPVQVAIQCLLDHPWGYAPTTERSRARDTLP